MDPLGFENAEAAAFRHQAEAKDLAWILACLSQRINVAIWEALLFLYQILTIPNYPGIIIVHTSTPKQGDSHMALLSSILMVSHVATGGALKERPQSGRAGAIG